MCQVHAIVSQSVDESKSFVDRFSDCRVVYDYNGIHLQYAFWDFDLDSIYQQSESAVSIVISRVLSSMVSMMVDVVFRDNFFSIGRDVLSTHSGKFLATLKRIRFLQYKAV